MVEIGTKDELIEEQVEEPKEERISASALKVKHPEITFEGERYLRIPIKTKVVVREDTLADIVAAYAKDKIQEGDILFITEKIVGITQGRAFPVKDIKARPLARFLSRHVTKTSAGIGLGMPETMEMALRECGVLRILFAAVVGAIGKLFGRHGDFYRLAGYKASSIDGPTWNTLPPYNEYVVLGPDQPDTVAKEMSKVAGCRVAVADINDLGGTILGASHPDMNKEKIAKILRDNPLGQCKEQTPMGIIRKLEPISES